MTDKKPILYIIRGLPGSGKSTYARKHLSHLLIMESDMFNICNNEYCWTEERQKDSLETMDDIFDRILEKKHPMDFCLCGVFAKPTMLAIKIGKALIYEYNVRVITCTKNYGNIHNVPQETLKKMKENFSDEKTIRVHVFEYIAYIHSIKKVEAEDLCRNMSFTEI